MGWGSRSGQEHSEELRKEARTDPFSRGGRGASSPSCEPMQHSRGGGGHTLALRARQAQEEAAGLAAELGSLESDVVQQGRAAQRCQEELEERTRALLDEFSQARQESKQRALAMECRQTALEQEASAMQRRFLADAVPRTGGADSSAAAAGDDLLSSALLARLSRAEGALSARGSLREEIQTETKLAEVRESCSEVERCLLARSGVDAEAEGGSGNNAFGCCKAPWVSRYEALIAAQAVLTERAAAGARDQNTAVEEQVLDTCSKSLNRLSAAIERGSGGRSPPEELTEVLRCMKGLAWSERRRRGLLMERWRELQGKQGSMQKSMLLS